MYLTPSPFPPQRKIKGQGKIMIIHGIPASMLGYQTSDEESPTIKEPLPVFKTVTCRHLRCSSNRRLLLTACNMSLWTPYSRSTASQTRIIPSCYMSSPEQEPAGMGFGVMKQKPSENQMNGCQYISCGQRISKERSCLSENCQNFRRRICRL